MPLAQRLEQRTHNAKVIGSSPIGHTIFLSFKNKKMKALFLFFFIFVSSFLFGQDVYQHPTEKGCYQFQVGRTIYDFCHDGFNLNEPMTFVYNDGSWHIYTSKLIIVFYYTEVRYIDRI